MITAIDTNILIDILEPDPVFGEASKQALRRCLQEGSVIACEVVWAEVVTAYSKKKKQVVLAKTNDGTVFKVSSINKIEEGDDNYSINLSVYRGDF